ncbi:hypothetical protein VP01_510g3 [Puccinia sorghi]|uniref:Uncharacterized protein n=1 Tax=Puccinia sorghi TaxID=27349 RepID=A0A0L6UL49_9BASI|nr:hypothetical protein VP01_510g3 [Puccinia sorghi]
MKKKKKNQTKPCQKTLTMIIVTSVCRQKKLSQDMLETLTSTPTRTLETFPRAYAPHPQQVLNDISQQNNFILATINQQMILPSTTPPFAINHTILWKEWMLQPILTLVTLDRNLSNPLDQNLYTLFGHQSTTIIYITHSLNNPVQLTHYTQTTHTTYPTTVTYNSQPIHSITWACKHACRLIKSILLDFTYLANLEFFFLLICNQFLTGLCSMAFPGHPKSLILPKIPQCHACRQDKIPHSCLYNSVHFFIIPSSPDFSHSLIVILPYNTTFLLDAPSQTLLQSSYYKNTLCNYFLKSLVQASNAVTCLPTPHPGGDGWAKPWQTPKPSGFSRT